MAKSSGACGSRGAKRDPPASGNKRGGAREGFGVQGSVFSGKAGTITTSWRSISVGATSCRDVFCGSGFPAATIKTENLFHCGG